MNASQAFCSVEKFAKTFCAKLIAFVALERLSRFSVGRVITSLRHDWRRGFACAISLFVFVTGGG